MSNEHYLPSPREIINGYSSRNLRSRGSSNNNLQTDQPNAVKDFVRSHNRKLGMTWLGEERREAWVKLGGEDWNALLPNLCMADRVAGYSEAQEEMLSSWQLALEYEPEDPQLEANQASVLEEISNVKSTTRTLIADIQRLARIAYTNSEVPVGLITGMNVLITDFNQSAVALDLLIERGVNGLTSPEAPIFQAFHKFWKSKENYYQIAMVNYSTQPPANRTESKHARLLTAIQDTKAVLKLLERAPKIQKTSRAYFERRLYEFEVLAQAIEVQKPLLGFRRLIVEEE